MINTQYLEELIFASGKTKTHLAKKCGITRANFYNKMKGVGNFTEDQATVLCDELNVTTMAERRKIFLSK